MSPRLRWRERANGAQPADIAMPDVGYVLDWVECASHRLIECSGTKIAKSTSTQVPLTTLWPRAHVAPTPVLQTP